MRAYEEYEEGFEKGKEVATETSLSEEAQKHVDIWMGRFDGMSKMWWRGFNHGKEGKWDPPEEDEESDEE